MSTMKIRGANAPDTCTLRSWSTGACVKQKGLILRPFSLGPSRPYPLPTSCPVTPPTQTLSAGIYSYDPPTDAKSYFITMLSNKGKTPDSSIT